MENESQKNISISSPCIRKCCLNEVDICLGCFRHIDEIVGWKGYNDKEKLSLLNTCHQREALMKK